MGIHASVLEKAMPDTGFSPARTPPAGRRTATTRAYAELTTRLFTGPESRRVVAFASVNCGEGVTRTVSGLALQLARAGKRTVALDGSFRPLPIPGTADPSSALPSAPPILGVPRAVESDKKPALLASLRDSCDALLLDLGSLENSVDLLRLAPAADALVLVVEAGRTTREQTDRAAQIIREAGGNLLGFVLNKRRYPIPAWLYHAL